MEKSDSVFGGFRKTITLAFLFLCFLFCVFLGIDFSMYLSCKKHVFYHDVHGAHFSKKDVMIVPGASVHGDALSGALKARMKIAVAFYKKHLVSKILISGDGTDDYYNETNAMRKYALTAGLSPQKIMVDEQGYSTALTIERAAKVFHIRSAYVVSQDYHLLRAVWLARKYHMNVDGLSAGSSYSPSYYWSREFLAKMKDFFLFKMIIVH